MPRERAIGDAKIHQMARNKKARNYAGLEISNVLDTDLGQTPDHSHSIINRSRKPAWLKGFAMINMGHYRRFYRHPTRALFSAEDEGV